jgi:5-formyltetrahydrofolate cyclo-ligase
MSVREEKRQMRVAAKAARTAAFGVHGSAGADAIATCGLGFAGIADTAIVSGFHAIGDEIDPRPLLERLSQAGHQICLPVIVEKGRPLLFRSWMPTEETREGVWGIREPLESAPSVEPDVLLVPLLAFDGHGFRLGYGGGFYDRTLHRLRSMKTVTAIGLAFGEQRLDAVPHNEHDQALDWILTPEGPLRCTGREG